MGDELKDKGSNFEQSIKNNWEKVSNRLNDTVFLKNIRTSVIFMIALGVPILYFGFFDSLTLAGLLDWKIGALAVISIALIAMIRIDTKARAFDDEIRSNKQLAKIEVEVQDEMDKIENHLLGYKFVEHFNKEQQRIQDELATTKEKNQLKRKKAKLEINSKIHTKAYKKAVKRLEYLKDHNVRGKYKPIDYGDLYTYSGKKGKSASQVKDNLKYNPKKDNPFSTVFGLVIKGSAIGGSGSLPFVVGASISTIFIFYLTFLLAIFLTVLNHYIATRFKTSNKYFESRKYTFKVLKQCNEFIADKELEQQRIETEKKKQIQEIEKDKETRSTDILPKINIDKLNAA